MITMFHLLWLKNIATIIVTTFFKWNNKTTSFHSSLIQKTCGNFSKQNSLSLHYKTWHMSKMATAVNHAWTQSWSAVVRWWHYHGLSTNGNFQFLGKQGIHFFPKKSIATLFFSVPTPFCIKFPVLHFSYIQAFSDKKKIQENSGLWTVCNHLNFSLFLSCWLFSLSPSLCKVFHCEK